MTRSSTFTLSALAKRRLVLGFCFGEGKRIPAEYQTARRPLGLAITNRCRIGKKQQGLRNTGPMLLRRLRPQQRKTVLKDTGSSSVSCPSLFVVKNQIPRSLHPGYAARC